MGKPVCSLILFFLSTQAIAFDSIRVDIGNVQANGDTTGTLTFLLSPNSLGSASTTAVDGPFLTGFLAAGARIKHDRWRCQVQWETLHNGGTFFRRAMEAGWDRRSESGLRASRWRGRWQWSPLESVNIEIGRDTLSEGWGLRSLFRGRHAVPAPFAQVELDGGSRVRYRHRVEALQGRHQIDCWTGVTGDPRTWVPTSGRLRTGIQRMVVSHRVEIDFGQRMTAALWGAVVWNVEDGQRAFEPHYLLPLTSLRPTEYAQGSSDNALVGVEGRIKLGKGWGDRPRTLYGQFLLDELIVSELLGGTEWWGNKFALLGGIRWDTHWGGWQWEVSAARPWTYSHYTGTVAYLNGITPLAHPLGANFVETAWEGRWRSDPWEVHARLTASVRGDDPSRNEPTGSLPQIGDIQRTEERYVWLNGTARQRAVAFLDVARAIRIGPDINVQAFAQAAWGRESVPQDDLSPESEFWLGLGLRSSGPLFGADW